MGVHIEGAYGFSSKQLMNIRMHNVNPVEKMIQLQQAGLKPEECDANLGEQAQDASADEELFLFWCITKGDQFIYVLPKDYDFYFNAFINIWLCMLLYIYI